MHCKSFQSTARCCFKCARVTALDEIERYHRCLILTRWSTNFLRLEQSDRPLLHFLLLDKGASERSLLLRAMMQFTCSSARNIIHANPSSVNVDDIKDFFTSLTKRACVGSPSLSKLIRELLATSHVGVMARSGVPSSQTPLSSGIRAAPDFSHTTPTWVWPS